MLLIEEKHVSALQDLYEENAYPSERLVMNESALLGFLDELNQRVGARYTPEMIRESVIHLRKDKKGTGGLPHIGRVFSGPRFVREG